MPLEFDKDRNLLIGKHSRVTIERNSSNQLYLRAWNMVGGVWIQQSWVESQHYDVLKPDPGDLTIKLMEEDHESTSDSVSEDRA